MDFYTLTAIKFALGILMMIFQINILGKRDFSVNTPLNQVQNYVLGGIIGGMIIHFLNIEEGGWIFSLIAATGGACILLWIVGLIKK